jgi:hypothetical protein
MLKNILVICTLAVCGIIGLQAIEPNIPSSIPIDQNNERTEKDLTPGALVCNGKEDKCVKDENRRETPSSLLFSVFCQDHQDEENLLACKDCQ